MTVLLAQRRATVALALFFLVASLGIAGCGSSGAAQRGTLRLPVYGLSGIPDPATASTSSAIFVADLLYSGLVKFAPDLRVIPELAVSMPTISNDGRTYTFTIRQDARFEDGRQVTAGDIAFALWRSVRLGARSSLARFCLGGISGAGAVERGRAGSLSGVRVLNPLTIRIHLRRADASFLEKLAFPVAAPLERRVLQANDGTRRALQAAGTGPWTVERTQRDGATVLAPRPHFYDGSLSLKKLVLVPVSSEQRGLDLYRKGDVDAAPVPPDRYGPLSSRSDFHHILALDAYYAVPLRGNASGLAATLDRDRLVQQAAPDLTSLPSIIPDSVPDYDSSPPTLDPPGPQATLAQTVELYPSNSGDWNESALQRALYRQWRRSAHAAYPVRLIHVVPLLPDPSAWLRLVLPYTHSRWYRSMLVASDELTNDPVNRMNSYSVAENWVLAKGLIIPLASSNVAYLIKPAVQGLEVTPAGIMPQDNSWPSVSVS